jgi:predicted RNase H-like HicB family nuclease
MIIATKPIKSNRKLLISQGEDGYFVIEVPSLPGCISQGKTREEALINIKEAIEAYLESLIKNNEPIPQDDYEVLEISI